MMRVMIFVLAVGLLLSAGCALTKKNEPKTLNEWGQLSRPKF